MGWSTERQSSMPDKFVFTFFAPLRLIPWPPNDTFMVHLRFAILLVNKCILNRRRSIFQQNLEVA
jgi:hypothetical protein